MPPAAPFTALSACAASYARKIMYPTRASPRATFQLSSNAAPILKAFEKGAFLSSRFSIPEAWGLKNFELDHKR